MPRSRPRRSTPGTRNAIARAPRTLREQVLAKAARIRALSRAHGAQSVELFGSAARGDDRPDSDIDMMVDMAPGRTLLDLIALNHDLEALLGRKVEVFSRAGLKPRVLAQARKEAVKVV